MLEPLKFMVIVLFVIVLFVIVNIHKTLRTNYLTNIPVYSSMLSCLQKNSKNENISRQHIWHSAFGKNIMIAGSEINISGWSPFEKLSRMPPCLNN